MTNLISKTNYKNAKIEIVELISDSTEYFYALQIGTGETKISNKNWKTIDGALKGAKKSVDLHLKIQGYMTTLMNDKK